jgi:Mn-dependent DtxR family transcriptional regulator
MKRDETIQNYLEAIHIISLDKENVRAIDIANYLGFSRPTVSIALKELERDDYIRIEENNIILSEKGKEVAMMMYERHEYIARVLMKLGVDEKTAYEDSCLIEHDLSSQSFEAIKKATIKFLD